VTIVIGQGDQDVEGGRRQRQQRVSFALHSVSISTVHIVGRVDGRFGWLDMVSRPSRFIPTFGVLLSAVV
jgi:hypothetical protein